MTGQWYATSNPKHNTTKKRNAPIIISTTNIKHNNRTITCKKNPKKNKTTTTTTEPQAQQQYYTQYIMLYSDINNINNIEYSEQNISRMDKWYINDQRKQTQHNIILVFNKLKQEQICTAHTRCHENQNCRQFQCFIYMQQYVWFLLLIYQSFYPLQFVASFKQVA